MRICLRSMAVVKENESFWFGGVVSSSSGFVTDFSPHLLLIFHTFPGYLCSVHMDRATEMSSKAPSEGRIHRENHLAMIKGASSPVISLHAPCIDLPQICGISIMGSTLPHQMKTIRFLATRCIRFESFAGYDCSSKTTNQLRKHLFALRTISAHCHDTEQMVADNN